MRTARTPRTATLSPPTQPVFALISVLSRAEVGVCKYNTLKLAPPPQTNPPPTFSPKFANFRRGV